MILKEQNRIYGFYIDMGAFGILSKAYAHKYINHKGKSRTLSDEEIVPNGAEVIMNWAEDDNVGPPIQLSVDHILTRFQPVHDHNGTPLNECSYPKVPVTLEKIIIENS